MTEPTPAPGGSDPGSEPAATHDTLAARDQAPPTAIFAARRAELGMSLEDVANQLKFSPRNIESLEAGEFDKLPGPTFARGMLRSYAKLLKLDPAPILAQLAGSGSGSQAGPEHAVSLRTPIPFSEGGKHGNLIYMVLSIVILAIVAFYAFDWYQEKGGPAKLAFVAPGRDAPASQPSPGPAPQVQESPAPGAQGAAPAVSARDAQGSTFASVGPAPVPETATAAPAAPVTLATPVPPGKRRIVMRFEKESWVEIKGRNGVTLLSQLNPAGSEKVIDGEPPFQLTIGNAPSVQVTYNDQPVDLKPHFKVDVARLTLE